VRVITVFNYYTHVCIISKTYSSHAGKKIVLRLNGGFPGWKTTIIEAEEPFRLESGCFGWILNLVPAGYSHLPFGNHDALERVSILIGITAEGLDDSAPRTGS
jgi:hypothetical protein